MTRFAARAVILGVLACPSLAVAQQTAPPPATSTEQNPSATAVPKNDAPPAQSAADTPDNKKPPSECKGLAEHPCRKNKACTWIIPKVADKTGQVPPAYCRKLGTTKAKLKNTAPPAATSP